MNITTLTSDISLKRQLEGGNEQQIATVREVVADNLRRGAATNAVKIYTEMVKNGLV